MSVDLSYLPTDLKVELRGEQEAHVLLETSRLRCEQLLAAAELRSRADVIAALASGATTETLRPIHREVGLAAYITSEDFSSEIRDTCLILARARANHLPGRHAGPPSRQARLSPSEFGPEVSRALATMFSETIAASDALAVELADRELDEGRRDRLREVHAHVMSACELLDERLTMIEVDTPGVTLS